MLRKLRMRHEAGEIDNEHSVDELVERYFKQQQHILAPRSICRYRNALTSILQRLRPRHVADITLDGVADYRNNRLAEGITTTGVEYEIGILKQVLRWGARQRITASNPIEYHKPMKSDAVPVVPFMVEEAEAMIESSNEHWQPILQVAFATGLRRFELSGLNAEDIDLNDRMISVPKRLGKQPASVRQIPILDCVYPVFQEACVGRKPGEPVFTTAASGGLYSALHPYFIRTAKRAGVCMARHNAEGKLIKRRKFHSTRHSFATWLRANGAEREKVEDLIGHKRSSVTDLYLAFDAGALRDAMSKHPWGPASPPEGIVPFLSQRVHKNPDAP